jgi:hypothetical protein
MRTDGGAAAAALRREWPRWTKVVAGYCRRGWRRRAMRPTAYAALYARVLAACAACAAAVPDGPQHDFYESLAELVRPWVSVEVLCRTDREILLHLLDRCRDADCRLRGVPTATGLRWAPSRLLLPLSLAALGGLALVLDDAVAMFGGRARRVARAVWYTARGMSMTEGVILLAILVVALALSAVRRDRHE